MAFSFCKNGENGYYWRGKPFIEPKKDCRFYDAEANNCTALKCLYCGFEHKDCAFYKKEEVR